MVKDNNLLGNFVFKIPPAQLLCGVPQIEVIFDIDASGILNASASMQIRVRIKEKCILNIRIIQLPILHRAR